MISIQSVSGGARITSCELPVSDKEIIDREARQFPVHEFAPVARSTQEAARDAT
jgi:hypothetical protein